MMRTKQECEQIQKRLDKRKSLVVFKDDLEISDLSLLIKRLMVEHRPTVSLYKDGHKRYQCGEDHARTVEDCYIVAKSYKPDITFEQVAKAVDLLVGANILQRSYCSTVRRDVHNPGIIKKGAAKTIRQRIGNLNIKFNGRVDRTSKFVDQ